MKRLSIVVPYRAREAHLRQFIPHVQSYFSRDKIDRDIPYRVLIVEQEQGLPFNRGAIKNVGFVLGSQQSDYTCFHDVDYLPIWADYTWVDTPTPIVWYGAESRPLFPGRSERATLHDLNLFFGGAILIPNASFSAVNGYANSYFGWGFEDEDLRLRFTRANIALGRRKGSFLPLDHDNEGFRLNGAQSPIAAVNEDICKQKWSGEPTGPEDGLSNLAFEVLNRQDIPNSPQSERAAPWEKVVVRLKMAPTAEQLQALSR